MLVATRHPLVRAGYRSLLHSKDGIEVVGVAGDAVGAVDLATETNPHVALLDLGLPGIENAQAIASVISSPALQTAPSTTTATRPR